MGIRVADTKYAKVRYLEEQVGRMFRNLQVLKYVELLELLSGAWNFNVCSS